MSRGQEDDETPGAEDRDRWLLGRFVVEAAGQRHTGLTADEVLALLGGGRGADAAVYRIHRVGETGRLELVGVSPEKLTRPDGMLFSRREAARARADFDALKSAAATAPPPCRIELELDDAAAFDPPHVVALLYCAACGEGVGQWLQRLGLRPGDLAEAGPAALRAYRAAVVSPIERAILAPAPDPSREG